MWQQIGPDGVDRAESQRAVELVLAAPRDLADAARLLQYALRLGNDLLAHRGDADFTLAALEQAQTQLFLELLHRHAERGLADEAGLGGAPEMPLSRHSNDVLEFVKGHNRGNLLTKSEPNTDRRICAAGGMGYYNLK